MNKFLNLFLAGSLFCIQAVFSFKKLVGDTGCQLQPITSQLHNRTQEIYTYKYGDGLHASNILSSVRHEGCSGQGACVWTFLQCDFNADHSAGVYVLKNLKYSTYLYANIAYAMSHVTDSYDNLCYVYKNYHHVIYFDPCDEQYYFYNLGYNQWVYASALNLVTHSDCQEDGQNYAHGCGDYRTMILRDAI